MWRGRTRSRRGGSSRALELSVPLRVLLAAAEDPKAHRDRDGADDDQRPQLVAHRRQAVALEDRVAEAVECISRRRDRRDRKSTRLNSSHQIISYAVFCLK